MSKEIETKFDSIHAYIKQEEKLFANRFWKEHKVAYASGRLSVMKELNQRFERELEEHTTAVIKSLNLKTN